MKLGQVLSKGLTIVRQAYAYLGPVQALVNVGGMPPWVRAAMAATSGGLLVVEHVLQGEITVNHTYSVPTEATK